MAQSQSPDEAREKTSATELDEGDRVFMGINLHGFTDDVPGTEYDEDIYQSGVEGTVTKALSDREKEMLDNGGRPLADFKIETDDGHTFTWNVDNGYVIGTKANGDVTDVGKIGGFYTA